MSRIRVLSDHLANQIAAGEVVERPASVAKELVENAIDAGARRLSIDIEAGGGRLMRVVDDGEGMTRDDALLAFERHATSKISRTEDLRAIATLGFRGEALASIASVARVELVTRTEQDVAGTRVVIEGGRMRDVKDAAHPKGTTIVTRDLFFNVPARRKFLRSEATENFHLINLVTHYALAHPEIAFALTNNGREVLRAVPARDLRERAYQVFGPAFLENLLEVDGGHPGVARIRGFVSAPRERRTSRDAQYLFVNGRYVRDRLLSRALSEGYRTILPHGTYPAALLFVEAPLEEVDVNVHPAKTEVRFRRAAAVADAVREAVYASLGRARHEGGQVIEPQGVGTSTGASDRDAAVAASSTPTNRFRDSSPEHGELSRSQYGEQAHSSEGGESFGAPGGIASGRSSARSEPGLADVRRDQTIGAVQAAAAQAPMAPPDATPGGLVAESAEAAGIGNATTGSNGTALSLPLSSIDGLVRDAPVESISGQLTALGQLDDSFIIATDAEGLLLVDQHIAHERILFNNYRALEDGRAAASQSLLMPETFDLTPGQASIYDDVAAELETYGFGLMRLSGRTVAIKAVPVDLAAGEARSFLRELLETVDQARRGLSREKLRERIAGKLACHAAIRGKTRLAPEKMRWVLEKLLETPSSTTSPHGRPVILRLAIRDIEKSFQRR